MKKWLLPILSGIFLILSYPPFSVIIFPFFSLLPLFFFLNSKNISPKKSFLAGFLAGFIFLGGVMFWLFDTLPLNWIGMGNEFLGFFLLLFSWLLLISVLAAFIGLFSLSYFFLSQKNFWDILLIPSLWVVFSYLRIWMFGLFLAGSESLLGPHWTFGSLAYTVAQNPNLRWISSGGGIYLVSFLVVLINVLFFILLQRTIQNKLPLKRTVSFLIVLGMIGLLLTSYFISFSKNNNEEGEKLKVTVLQTKFPSSFSQTKEIAQEKFQVQTRLLKNISGEIANNEIIVFPEGSNFLKQEGAKEVLSDFFEEKDILILDSGRDQGKFVGKFYHVQKGILVKYEKILLVPYGDYLPFIFRPLARIIDKNWIKKFRERREKERGSEIIVVSPFGENKISVLFCSETVSPNLHREFTKKNSEVFFNSGSLAFSNGSKSLDAQTLSMLRLRAAENGRYLVRATNYGSSYVIDNKGKIIKKTPNFENQVLLGEIKPLSPKTFYTRFGDWILILAFGITLFRLIFKKSKLTNC